MKNFFSNDSKNKLSTLRQNILNGKTAERYFASLLTIALDARVSFTSRTEDDSKLDLVTIMSHPWEVNKVEIFFTQIKSGKSYCRVENDKFIVDNTKFQEFVGRNHNSLVCWINVDEKIPYWFFIKSNSQFFKTDYNLSHILSPLTKFDLIRLVTAVNNQNGGKGLIFNRKNSVSDYEKSEYINLRNVAKIQYKKFKSSKIINPIFGKIEITKLGWRHITRESRWYRYEVASLEIIVILENILNLSPSKHYIIKQINTADSDFNYRENEYLLHYDSIKVFDKEKNKLIEIDTYIKLLEIGAYLKEWKDKPNSTTIANRKVIFKSIYYKIKQSS